ncbi:MAG: hypothetical protein ACE5J9_01550 [Methanosarcinales archaeon]
MDKMKCVWCGNDKTLRHYDTMSQQNLGKCEIYFCASCWHYTCSAKDGLYRCKPVGKYKDVILWQIR